MICYATCKVFITLMIHPLNLLLSQSEESPSYGIGLMVCPFDVCCEGVSAITRTSGGQSAS